MVLSKYWHQESPCVSQLPVVEWLTVLSECVYLHVDTVSSLNGQSASPSLSPPSSLVS